MAYEKQLSEGRVQCTVCPNFCVMDPGGRGRCLVRQNRGGHVVCTTYGRASGMGIDPIEKKPLNHFLPGTNVLSFGTAGCNLSCQFCQNWHLSHAKEVESYSQDALPETIAENAVRQGCRSVAFTYNEPTIFWEYARDTAIACHEHGIKTVSVTCGYINPEPCRELYRHIDAANVDLKAFTDDFYQRLCGVHLQPVLDTIEYLVNETDVWVELTTLLIPGENDSDEEIDAMTKWVVKTLGPYVPMHFTAFHPAGNMLNKPPTSLKNLERAWDIAKKNGVQYIYVGNVRGSEKEHTYCHQCGKMLIERSGFYSAFTGLNPDGTCSGCGTRCAGIFE